MGKKAIFKLLYCTSVLLTAALAGVTLLSAHTHKSPELSAFYPFVNLLLLPLLLANVVAMLYWLLRWRIWLLIPVLALAGSWNYIGKIYRFGSEPERTVFTESESTGESESAGNTSADIAPTGNKFTVATYNVGSFNNEGMGYSCKSIAGYMASQGVDVVCMQEFGVNQFFPLDSVKNAFAQWPYVYIPQSEEPLLQLAIFSRYPIAESQLITYGTSRNCSAWCDIEVQGNRLRIFNNHLQTTELNRNRNQLERELTKKEPTAEAEAAAMNLLDAVHRNFIVRARQADTLRTHIDACPYPMLVCGDFNSLPSSYTYHKVKGKENGKEKNLRDGFETCGHGYMYTFRFLKRLLRIDYIFHSPQLQGLDYYSDDLEYSDHNPVVMQVEFINN